jgi:hypothetical protein
MVHLGGTMRYSGERSLLRKDRIMVTLLLLASLTSPGAVDMPKNIGRGCLPTAMQDVGDGTQSPYHRLDQLPPAAEILT